MSTRTTRAKAQTSLKAKREAAKKRAERNRRIRLIAVVTGAVAVFAVIAGFALSTAATSGPKTDANGTTYSADKNSFVLPGLLDDKTVSLHDYVGTPVVVNFFASWCVYCNEELPGFVQVAKTTAGKVQFIGVNTDDTGDGAAMAKRFDLPGAGFALAKDIGANPASELWTAYGSQGLPVTAFYNSAGTMVDFSGGMLTETALEQRLQKDFGIDVSAPDANALGSPVIPLIPKGAYELLSTHPNNPDYVALDIRSAQLFAGGHIDGAKNIPYGHGFAAATAKLDKSANYFLYDAGGTVVTTAADELHAAGFKHVYYVEGGYDAWVQAGGPTTK